MALIVVGVLIGFAYSKNLSDDYFRLDRYKGMDDRTLIRDNSEGSGVRKMSGIKELREVSECEVRNCQECENSTCVACLKGYKIVHNFCELGSSSNEVSQEVVLSIIIGCCLFIVLFCFVY